MKKWIFSLKCTDEIVKTLPHSCRLLFTAPPPIRGNLSACVETHPTHAQSRPRMRGLSRAIGCFTSYCASRFAYRCAFARQERCAGELARGEMLWRRTFLLSKLTLLMCGAVTLCRVTSIIKKQLLSCEHDEAVFLMMGFPCIVTFVLPCFSGRLTASA
jgi:hypothetical protein